jgi:hypothetical protein
LNDYFSADTDKKCAQMVMAVVLKLIDVMGQNKVCVKGVQARTRSHKKGGHRFINERVPF